MANQKIPQLNSKLIEDIQQKIDQKTKPLGALGILESLAFKIACIQQTLQPQLSMPTAFVFAGDHGIVAEGISLYPQAVTAQMVLNFVRGGAAINVFAKQMDVDLHIVDAGVNTTFDGGLPIHHLKVAHGTKNFLQEAAMTAEQCQIALTRGAQVVSASVNKGANVFAFGEMGIGNTTSAAAIMSVLCKLPPAECAGRGTGLDNAGVAHKISVIEQAIKRHEQSLTSPEQILRYLGGFEIAMMVGAMLQAASTRALVIVDGFICSAAALVAAHMHPNFLDYCIFAHASQETGHQKMLAHLGVNPILDLHLRLGEGTGAVLAYPILQAAVNFLNEMASFESAEVSQQNA